MKYFYAILFFIVLSYAENIAEFCFQPAKDASLDLKIKHNVDIELPLSEIAKYTICEDKWHPQVDLDVNYEIDFPKEWNCNTLVPLWCGARQ